MLNFSMQENANIRRDLESDVSLNESFHEQDPEHLGHLQSPKFNQPHNTIITHSHPSEIYEMMRSSNL